MNDTEIEQVITRVVASTLEKVLGPMPTPEPFLSTTELAALLKASAKTIRDWGKQGCPHVRVGKDAHRWRVSEVVAWLQSRP